MPFVVGETIGSYRIVQQLGQGGMATVFKAYHPLLERYVALKALHPAFKEDPNFLGRFQREAKVVAKLEHPNIVPIFDFAEHEGRPYLVMKYIEGETLKARMSRESLAKHEIIAIVESVGAALSYAHNQGILHRDVKPSNVLLGNDGQIYLADFGLARIAQAGESSISSDMLVGTPQYISPEQAMGKSDLDAGTDIYSFGVMLYEMVTGKVPFNADTPYAIIHDHIYSPLPLPSQINPNVSQPVENVLLKALAKERPDRFPDIQSLVSGFNKAIKDQGELPSIHDAPVPPDLIGVNPPSTIEEQPEQQIQIATSSPPISGIKEQKIVSPLAETTAPSTTTTSVKKTDSKLKKKPYEKIPLWVVIPTILGLFVICGFLGFRFFRAYRQNTLAMTPTTTANTTDSLEVALQNVADNPKDPKFHLELAIVYIDINQPDPAQNELQTTLNLVGENPQFYNEAGNRAGRNGKWIVSAWSYLQMAQLTTEPLPDEAEDRFHEAIYKAFQQPQAIAFIPIQAIQSVDESIAGVAEAESEFRFGSKTRSEAILQALLKIKVDFPEGRLLLAQIILDRQPDLAKQILQKLRRDSGVANWIQKEATQILNSNKP